jgi:hypothetical protein
VFVFFVSSGCDQLETAVHNRLKGTGEYALGHEAGEIVAGSHGGWTNLRGIMQVAIYLEGVNT